MFKIRLIELFSLILMIRGCLKINVRLLKLNSIERDFSVKLSNFGWLYITNKCVNMKWACDIWADVMSRPGGGGGVAAVR